MRLDNLENTHPGAPLGEEPPRLFILQCMSLEMTDAVDKVDD